MDIGSHDILLAFVGCDRELICLVRGYLVRQVNASKRHQVCSDMGFIGGDHICHAGGVRCKGCLLLGTAVVLADYFEMALGGWYRLWEVLLDERGGEAGPF